MYEVAVIIPTYNEQRFIELCIKSVIHQTYPFNKLDVMVVDGGSSDSTCEIVKALARQYSNIRLLHNEYKIQSVAFNVGVNSSNAPYIVRLDAHVVYHADYINLCVKHLKENTDYGNVGGVLNVLPQYDGLITEANAILNKSRFGIGGASFRVGTQAGFVDTVPFGAFPRKVVEQIGGMREDLVRGEDNEYNSRIKQNGYKIYLDPNIVADYYARDTIIASMKQMYLNGKSIGNLVYIDFKSLSIRHIIPFAFVISIFCCICIGFVDSIFWWLLGIIVFAYASAAIVSTIIACRKYGWKYFFILPILFFLVHSAYGYGTFVGLLRL